MGRADEQDEVRKTGGQCFGEKSSFNFCDGEAGHFHSKSY